MTISRSYSILPSTGTKLLGSCFKTFFISSALIKEICKDGSYQNPSWANHIENVLSLVTNLQSESKAVTEQDAVVLSPVNYTALTL